jgi:hypothetical protein
MPVQAELALEEKERKYGNAFKSAVFNLRAKKISEASEATQEKARKIQAATWRQRAVLGAILASLAAMLANGGLVNGLLNTAEQQPIRTPPQGWAQWFAENGPDRFDVLRHFLFE